MHRAVKRVDCIVIQCPSWFQRDDFREWRRSEPRKATWDSPDQEPADFSDTFLIFDASGSYADWSGDGETLPDDIYQEIGTILEAQCATHGILWLQNLEVAP